MKHELIAKALETLIGKREAQQVFTTVAAGPQGGGYYKLRSQQMVWT